MKRVTNHKLLMIDNFMMNETKKCYGKIRKFCILFQMFSLQINKTN